MFPTTKWNTLVGTIRQEHQKDHKDHTEFGDHHHNSSNNSAGFVLHALRHAADLQDASLTTAGPPQTATNAKRPLGTRNFAELDS